MTIQTMEELRAVPVGHSILIDQTRGLTEWTRSEQGFTADGRTLLPDLFVGHISMGRVRVIDHTAPRVGEWWQHGVYYYYVFAVDEAVGTTRSLLVRPDTSSPDVIVDTPAVGSFRAWTRVLPEAMGPMLNERVVTTMASMLMRLSTESNSRADEIRVLKRRPEPERVANDLRELRARIDTMLGAVEGH